MPAPATTGPAPRANRGVLGIPLSGRGAHLKPPISPSYKPSSDNCQDRGLLDPGFTGKCVTAEAATGTVTGVVEEETAALPAGPGAASTSVQERDLVWHREGGRWALAEVHTFWNANGRATLLWSDDIRRDHDTELVFVTMTDETGFGSELDLVGGTGQVSLYRYLGVGFAVVPTAGRLVTYVPGSTEQEPADDGYYDQTLIGYSDGSWRVFSEQYVPGAAALAQHHGAFWDPEARPAW
jgi:hypothetical protein